MTEDRPKSPTFGELYSKLVANVELVLKGKRSTIEEVVICLLAGGHLLIEDVPGLGKTTFARSLAASTQMQWHRIQFTPDLLPSDVTGNAIFNMKTSEFEFRPGAVFANIVLADEINRASPKTQSALLEVMEEGTVTSDRTIYTVPRPFMVIATQNPIDMDGTYSLPEAQMDRFLMKISVGYPSAEAEATIIAQERNGATVENLKPVLTVAEITAMIAYVKQVKSTPQVDRYIVDLCAATRENNASRLGASPRGSLALLRSARASAAIDGRAFVTPDDVKRMAHAVLTHRVIVKPEAELSGITAKDVVDQAMSSVPVPHALAE